MFIPYMDNMGWKLLIRQGVGVLPNIREIPHPSIGWGWIAGQKRKFIFSSPLNFSCFCVSPDLILFG
jgi:hypothetical protein